MPDTFRIQLAAEYSKAVIRRLTDADFARLKLVYATHTDRVERMIQVGRIATRRKRESKANHRRWHQERMDRVYGKKNWFQKAKERR